MHARRQSPSPHAQESCFKPVMTHIRTSRRVSRRFTTGKTSRPQWATSLLGWHGPRTAGGRTEAYRSAAGSYRSVTGQGRTGMSRENRAQECHAQGGMGRTDRRESCSWEPLHLTARGSRALTPGRVMEATGLPSSAGLPGIPNPAGPTGPLGAPSCPESPRQPRAARKARDPGLSGLARRGHNQG